MTQPRRHTLYLWLAAAVLLLAALARIHHLTRLDFWVDEAWTVWFSVLDAMPWDTLERVAADVHPPLYFLAVNLWIGAAGFSEQAIRLLSAWPSVIAVALVIRLGRDWFGRWGGVLSGLVLALSMYHIWFAQEARHYAALTLFAALSMLLYTRWLRIPSRRRALWWIAANALMLWTHYLGVLVIATQGAHLLLLHRRRLRAALLMLAGVLLLFAPWIPVFLGQITNDVTHNAGGLGQTVPTNWANIWAQVEYLTSSQPLLYALLLLLAAWGTRMLVRKDRNVSTVGAAYSRAQHAAPLQKRHRDAVLLAWLWAFLPLIALFAVNTFFRIYNTRNALLVMPGFALVCGFGLNWLLRRAAQANARPPLVWRSAAAALLLAVIILTPQVTQHHRPAITDEKPVRDVIEAVAAHFQPGDIIFIDPNCFGCYNPHEWEYYERLLIGQAVPIYQWAATPEGEPTGEFSITADWPRPPTTTDDLSLPPRIWYVSDLRGRDETSTLARLQQDRREIASGGIYELTGQLFVQPPGPEFTFGEDGVVHLRGAELPAAAPGETIILRLWWQTDEPLDADYSVSARLVDSDGALVAQHDGPPTELFQGEAYPWPTSGWEPGAFILDDHPLPLPAGLAPGDYTIQVIFYQWWDNIRWTAFDAGGNPVGDAAPAATLTIQTGETTAP